jgi:hypothetical protein
MNSQLASQLESAPYDAATAASLEAYVTSQLSSKSYDFGANKALLKNYQVNSAVAKADFIARVLVLALMRLPSSDFLSLTYMVPPHLTTDSKIVTVQKCADLLERGRFREFWEQYIHAQGMFSEAVGFVDSIRLFIVGNLRDTFKDMPKALFEQQLGLDNKTVVSFCDSNKFIEKVCTVLSLDFSEFRAVFGGMVYNTLRKYCNVHRLPARRCTLLATRRTRERDSVRRL